MKALLLALPLMMPPPLPELQPFQGFVPPRQNIAICIDGVCSVHEAYFDALVAKSRQCAAMRGERFS